MSEGIPPPKEKLSASQLADMITARIGIEAILIVVKRDPTYGWHATVLTAPAETQKCQMLAEQIATELRAKYDLAEF